MKQYLDTVRTILFEGTRKENRTGVDTLSTFGLHYNIDLASGFPLLTTKAMKWSNVLIENLWFLSGDTNIDFLHHYGVKFWDAWVDPETGNVPSAYGNFWRWFPTHANEEKRRAHAVALAEATHTLSLTLDTLDEERAQHFTDSGCDHSDQIAWAIETLKRDPSSRRVVVSAWAPGNAQVSKLPPCHVLFVLNVQHVPKPLAVGDVVEWLDLGRNTDGSSYPLRVRGRVTKFRDGWLVDDLGGGNERPLPKFRRADGALASSLCLHLTQRSCDIALGVPYNIAGYAFLLHLFARFTGLAPGVFSHTLVDAHVYTSKPDGSMSEYDHVPGLIQQLGRIQRPLPTLTIDPSVMCLADVERIIRDRPPVEELLRLFRLDGYDPWPAIPFKVAV